MYGPSFKPLASKYLVGPVYLALGLAAAACVGAIIGMEILNRYLTRA
jgi:hypothetical protein